MLTLCKSLTTLLRVSASVLIRPYSIRTRSIKDCYSMFYLTEDCPIEELQAAYDRQLRRNSNDLKKVEEIHTAYHKITQDRFSKIEPAHTDDENDKTRRKYFVPRFKSASGIDKFVDDMVVKDMKNLDLSSNPGFGKPLPKKYDNPYMDNLERKMNEIMQNNEAAVEWIQKKRDILEDLRKARTILREYYLQYLKTENPKLQKQFEKAEENFCLTIKDINKHIHEYNMIIPAHRFTLFPYNPEKECNRIIDECQKLVANDDKT